MTGELAPSGDGDEPDPELIPSDDSGEPDPELVSQVARRFMELVHEVNTVQSYSGPLPPASEFARYEEAVEGAGERIISLAENSSKRTYEAHLDDNRLGRHVIWSVTVVAVIVFTAQVIISRDLISAGSVELGSIASLASAVFVGLGVLLTWRRGRRSSQDASE